MLFCSSNEELSHYPVSKKLAVNWSWKNWVTHFLLIAKKWLVCFQCFWWGEIMVDSQPAWLIFEKADTSKSRSLFWVSCRELLINFSTWMSTDILKKRIPKHSSLASPPEASPTAPCLRLLNLTVVKCKVATVFVSQTGQVHCFLFWLQTIKASDCTSWLKIRKDTGNEVQMPGLKERP